MRLFVHNKLLARLATIYNDIEIAIGDAVASKK